MWEPRSLATLWASTACNTDIFTFLPSSAERISYLLLYSFPQSLHTYAEIVFKITVTLLHFLSKSLFTDSPTIRRHLRLISATERTVSLTYIYFGSRDSAVGIATGYGLDDRGGGVRILVGSRIFSSPRPDRIWGPPSLLSNGYRKFSLKRKPERRHGTDN
jgi:hypothetical protein